MSFHGLSKKYKWNDEWTLQIAFKNMLIKSPLKFFFFIPHFQPVIILSLLLYHFSVFFISFSSEVDDPL